MADQLAQRRPRKDPRHIMFRVERATLASGEVVGALVPRFGSAGDQEYRRAGAAITRL